MTSTDPVIPLATASDFAQTAFADLATNLQDGELDTIMREATRACEGATRRRLAPFTITESHRAEGIDPDEYGSGITAIPTDLAGSTGMSYARALGSNDLVRHLWLSETAPRYQDLWTYSVQQITIIRSIGGTQNVLASTLSGPEPDTGHMLFQLGTFLPIGSTVRVTYAGGYTVAIPADLAAACKTMAASIVLKRLDPTLTSSTHDPGALRDEAIELLEPYIRD